MSLSPPGVRLFYDPRGHHAGAINELCWGLEEQGVPCQTITYDGGGDAAAPVSYTHLDVYKRQASLHLPPAGFYAGGCSPARRRPF